MDTGSAPNERTQTMSPTPSASPADAIAASLSPSDFLVAYRRITADRELFAIAYRTYGRVQIAELDLDEPGVRHLFSTTSPSEPGGRDWINAELTRCRESILDRLEREVSEGLCPEPTRNPRLAELRLRALAGDNFARRAVQAYATDAELEAAEAESRNADFTS